LSLQFCPNMRLIMTSEWPNNPKHLDMIHVRCKMWSCEYCAAKNASVWKNYILTRLSRSDFVGKAWVMLTITAHENAHKAGPLYTLKNLQRGWKNLYHRLLRWNGGKFEYIRIFEKHTKGKYGGYHMHIIADLGETHVIKKMAFFEVLEREKRARKQGKKPRKRLKKEVHPQRWLLQACKKLGMGYEVDFKYIGSVVAKTAAYMTKYVGKQFEILEFPPRMRRIQPSRRFGSPQTMRGPSIREWRAKSAIFKEDLRRWDKIIDQTMKRIVSDDDFEGGKLWYPPQLK
jgi:hypothetical protein